MKPQESSSSTGRRVQNKARKEYEETVLRAFRVYVEAKAQADVAHSKVMEQANDRRTREEADKKYKEGFRAGKEGT